MQKNFYYSLRLKCHRIQENAKCLKDSQRERYRNVNNVTRILLKIQLDHDTIGL